MPPAKLLPAVIVRRIVRLPYEGAPVRMPLKEPTRPRSKLLGLARIPADLTLDEVGALKQYFSAAEVSLNISDA